jgi:hypothetical protein
MERNKRTETRGHDNLAPLTEQILARMGAEGADIRQRLKNFYRRRALATPHIGGESLDKPA